MLALRAVMDRVDAMLAKGKGGKGTATTRNPVRIGMEGGTDAVLQYRIILVPKWCVLHFQKHRPRVKSSFDVETLSGRD